MAKDLIKYVEQDLNELSFACGHMSRVLKRLEPLKGTTAHGLPQTLSSARSKVIGVINALEDYAELIQDGDAVPGQNVNTYV